MSLHGSRLARLTLVVHRSRNYGAEGFTLVEVLIAASLLLAGSLAAGRLFAATASANLSSRFTTRATVLAIDKIEQLRALPVDDPRLQPSPPDTLQGNVDGFSDRPAESCLRRWSIEPLPAYPDSAIVVRVVVVDPSTGVRAQLETIRALKKTAGG